MVWPTGLVQALDCSGSDTDDSASNYHRCRGSFGLAVTDPPDGAIELLSPSNEVNGPPVGMPLSPNAAAWVFSMGWR